MHRVQVRSLVRELRSHRSCIQSLDQSIKFISVRKCWECVVALAVPPTNRSTKAAACTQPGPTQRRACWCVPSCFTVTYNRLRTLILCTPDPAREGSSLWPPFWSATVRQSEMSILTAEGECLSSREEKWAAWGQHPVSPAFLSARCPV